jgi:predicted permease
MTLRGVVDGMARLFGKARAERELDDELRHYLSLAVDEKVRAGLSRAEAERIARVEMGGIEATKERVRSGGWEARVETFVQDARYALRGLRRNPAFTAIAILTLALGIGANTAMFSVVSAVLLRPLPYRDANAVALIWTDDVRRGLHREATAYPTITDWRSENRSFVDVAYYSTGRTTLGATAAGTGPRERSRAAFSSANLLPLLGVAPVRGRIISPDDEANAEPVAVISYGLWQRRYGGSDDVIGRTIGDDSGDDKGDNLRRTIIGVMPQGFYFPDKQTEVWTPATTYWRFRRESVERFSDWARRWTAVARLKPGVSMTDARADLARVGRQLSATHASSVPDFPGFATSVVPILDFVTGTTLQSALWILLGAVGLVLLVGCANVANLLLARGAVRQHEFAIRRAIGAGRMRLVRQLVVESLLLASLGGALGFALAVWGTRALSLAVASQVPRIDELGVDSRVLAFTAAISILAGVVFGLVPALRVSSVDPSEVLKESATRGSVRLRRGRGLLVTAECALAIVLLTGAGLLLRSLGRLRAVDPGFDPRSVLAVRVEFPPQAAVATGGQINEPAMARAQVQRLDDLMARLATLPGVESAGLIDDMFLTGQGHASITIPGRATDSLPEGELNAAAVTPGFFAAMHVPLRHGRQLTRDDVLQKIRALWSGSDRPQSNAAPVLEPVVVNEAFVHRYFPDDDPLGKRFLIDPTNKTYWYMIVGVVGDMRRQGLERQPIAEYYGAYVPRPIARADVLLRTRGNPIDIAPIVRAVIGQVLPGSLISGVSTADAQLGDFSAQRRFQTWLLSAFAALALLLAAVGIYGVVHYAVAERRREIGIRIALGASPADVMSMVVAQGMRLPVLGIIVGLAASVAVSRLISHLLFNVGATDPATFAAVGLVLAVAAFAACYAPARRATTIDPVQTLRQD